MSNEIALNFYDVCLRKSDVDLLEDGQWLNDQLISFAYEFFRQRKFSGDSGIVFLDPDTVQLLKFADPKEILAPLELKPSNLIFFPFNDNELVNSCGGTHWSLLIYFDGIFAHFDSGGGINSDDARKLARKFAPVFGDSEKFLKIPNFSENSQKFFVPSFVPQQNNSYDCGIFVIMFSEKIAEEYSKSGKDFQIQSLHFGNFDPKDKRVELQKLIDALHKEIS